MTLQTSATAPPRAPTTLLSEDRPRRLTTMAPVGIFETDAAGQCVFVNERWCRFAGLTPQAALGQGWVAALHPDDRDRVLQQWTAAAGTGGEFAAEYRFRRPDGSITWLSGAAVALRNDEGGVTGYLGTVTDITSRKQVEEALAAAESRLETVLSSINDHLVCYDRQWRYTYVNDGAARVLGRTKEELLGNSIWELFPDAVGNQYYRELHQALAEQRVIRSAHYYAPFKSWFENHIYPTPGGVTVFSADITWRKHLEEELRRRNEQLAEADRQKDEFLAMLAHELRNPLAPVRNAIEVLKRPEADAAIAGQMRQLIERQVDLMARLLDDLLDVARISRGRIELRPVFVDVAAVIGRSVEAVRPTIERHGHQLSVELPAGRLTVRADPTRLEQVLVNLLNNAAKYTERGGRIAVIAERSDDDAVLRVRDTGVGISSDLLPHVFDLFVQAERPEGATGGIGIGLTLVKRLVELHGGTVAASSDGPGRGSEFVVRLPALAPSERALDVAAPGGKPVALPRRRVLVADDNHDAADSLALLLRLANQEVLTAYDGPGALKLAREFRPDAMFLDIGMAGMDGFEVARAMRAHPELRSVLLVAVTGWGLEKDRRRSATAGFDHHVTKPVAFETIENLLLALPARRG